MLEADQPVYSLVLGKTFFAMKWAAGSGFPVQKSLDYLHLKSIAASFHDRFCGR